MEKVSEEVDGSIHRCKPEMRHGGESCVVRFVPVEYTPYVMHEVVSCTHW